MFVRAEDEEVEADVLLVNEVEKVVINDEVEIEKDEVVEKNKVVA